MELRAGYKQTEVGVIPEDWGVAPLGDMFAISAGGDFDPTVASNFQDATYLYPIYSNALTDAGLYGYTSSPVHGSGSVTVTARGMIGSANCRTTPFTAIGRVIVLHPKGAHDGRYFATFVNEKIAFAVESTGVPQLTAPQISRYQTAVPPLPEQRAIAAALSDADALIASMDALIAKKRDLKQAAMQQLLTGMKRLPGYAGEWEVKRLGDVAPLQRGFDLPTTQIQSGPFPVVYSNGALNTHNKFQVKGPGLVTGRSGTIGNVTFVQEDFWPHNTALWVTSFKGNNPRFVFYLYTSLGFERFATGSGVPTLNRNDVHAHKVELPSDPAEQSAIAEVLGDMDAELAALQAQREKARSMKQGMVQGLLTGRIRLV